MKQAHGFITADGSFFESEYEAELHEAHQTLVGLMSIAELSYPDSVLSFIGENNEAIERYIKASRVLQAVRREQETDEWDGLDPEDEADKKDEAARDDQLTSVLKQSVGIDEYVPNMGRGQQPEKVQHRSKVDGSRGREPDARRVRGSEDMATSVRSGPTVARPKNGPKDIRKEAVRRDTPKDRTKPQRQRF